MNKTPSVAIIGAGAAGCVCAYFLSKENIDITIFDKGAPLRTLLPTGGGRCNLAHAEYDFKELAKNYPRGEKFLYSVFSRFSTSDTIELFESLGIKTYTQDDRRIFPKTNSAKMVRDTILKNIPKVNIEEVTLIENKSSGYLVKTSKAEYFFDKIVVAIGGHSGYKILENLGINIIPIRPSLVGLNTKENFKPVSGTVIKNVISEEIRDNLLFTHFGISGPLVYKISSVKAFDKLPYEINLDLCPELQNLQEILNNNPHKEIKNLLALFLPSKIVNLLLYDIDGTTKAHNINSLLRNKILDRIHTFRVNILSTNKGEETVTAGGINLDEINSKTMECKKLAGLYCIGEVLNIDGFCGGFNLQNAWSTAFIAAQSILSNK